MLHNLERVYDWILYNLKRAFLYGLQMVWGSTPQISKSCRAFLCRAFLCTALVVV